MHLYISATNDRSNQMQVVLASEFPVDADTAEQTHRPFQPRGTKGGQRGQRGVEGGAEGGAGGGQRSFSVQRPATNQLPSPFGAPARPRQIDKDLSECDNTAISHSLRHTFLNSSTYSDNFKGCIYQVYHK